MKLIIDLNNKVMDYTLNGEFIITEQVAQIKEGNNIRLTYGGYNSSNCYQIEIENLSENVVGKIYDKSTSTFSVDLLDPNTTADDIALAIAPEYIKSRVKDYKEQGITERELIVALWEDIVENRPEAKNIIQAKRLAIKINHPKT